LPTAETRRRSLERNLGPRPPKPDLLSMKEAAEYLHMTERWVKRSVIERRFPSARLGNVVRIERTDLDAYLANSRRETRDATEG